MYIYTHKRINVYIQTRIYTPIGILCQVWYLFVSIPDLCTLTDFTYIHTHNRVRNRLMHQTVKRDICYKHVFLDTQSRLDEDRIRTDLYTKPTNSHQYLLPTS